MERDNIKVSIIVPVYNVAKYLANCLDTLINQTMQEIEIICVNDGSTDDSGQIIDEYAKKDKRIVVIEKSNGGLSSARNVGMNIAQGEFITFVDSDDWVDISFCEKLYNSLVQNNADITICAVHQFDNKKKCNDDSNPYYTLGFFDESFDNRVFCHRDTKKFLLDVCVMAWNKMYRKSFLDSLNAKFPEGLIFEDGPFFFSIFFKTERVTLLREFLYYYRVNRRDSIIEKADEKFFNIFDVITLMYNYVEEVDYFEEIKYEFFKKKTEDLFGRSKFLQPKFRYEYFEKMKNFDILYHSDVFDFAKVNEEYPYIYYVVTEILKGGYKGFSHQQKVDRWKYKVIEILCHEPNAFYIHSKKYNKTLRIKKRPKYYDIWYDHDVITFVFFQKFTFKIKFMFSPLERRNRKRA